MLQPKAKLRPMSSSGSKTKNPEDGSGVLGGRRFWTERRPIRWAVMLAVFLSLARCASCIDRTYHPEAIRHNDAGIEYMNAGKCVQAEERFRLALEYGPNFAHPHNGLGMVSLLCHGDLDQASQHFKDAIALEVNFAEAHNNLGTTFFRKTPPEYDTACDEFKAAIEIDPAYFDARENFGMCLMRKGTIAGDKGDTDQRADLYSKARSHLIRLLEMSPGNYNARHHLGFMDLIEDNYPSAEEHFKRCLDLDPENPICSFNLGNLYIETARCSDAIPAFIAALRDPDAADVAVGARQNLGVAYVMCAKNDGALRTFLDKIRADPSNPLHHFDLGQIYYQKGLNDEAVNEWENTLKLDPTFCPAHYELAQYANKVLDTDRTLQRCRDFVSCANEANRKTTPPRWSREMETCKQLVRQLEME